MGKVVRTITMCSCDICGKECNENENSIEITTSYSLNDRCYMFGSVHAYIPYGTSQGVVCKSCKLDYLERYVLRERGRGIVI